MVSSDGNQRVERDQAVRDQAAEARQYVTRQYVSRICTRLAGFCSRRAAFGWGFRPGLSEPEVMVGRYCIHVL